MEIVYPPVIGAAKMMFRALDLRIDINGAQHIPRTGGAVLASNHVSYLDFIFCGLGAQPAGRLVRFMAKKEVFDHRVSGPLMRGMKHIPVDRQAGTAAFREATTALKNGEVVGRLPRGDDQRVLHRQGAQVRCGADGPYGEGAADPDGGLGSAPVVDQGAAEDPDEAARAGDHLHR